jgi:ABC-type branched-subunit amino acid transport system permease subunit
MSLENAEEMNRQAVANQERSIEALAASIDDGSAKYAYFLLAAAGACLAYGLQKLDGQPRGLPILLAIAAYLAWLLSILMGCLSLQNAHRTRNIMLDQLYLILGNTILQNARDTCQKELVKLDTHLNEAKGWHMSQQACQFYLLVVGGAVFSVWRLLAWWLASAPAG